MPMTGWPCSFNCSGEIKKQFFIVEICQKNDFLYLTNTFLCYIFIKKKQKNDCTNCFFCDTIQMELFGLKTNYGVIVFSAGCVSSYHFIQY